MSRVTWLAGWMPSAVARAAGPLEALPSAVLRALPTSKCSTGPGLGPRLVHMPSDPSGPQRSPAVSSGRSFAQVAGAILRKQALGQNPDKDEVPGSSPGRPTTYRRRSQRCRQRAGRARCRLGPRWGRTPIPAGTSSGPSGSAHPGGRLGDDHPPWSPTQPRTPATRRGRHLALQPAPVPTAQPPATGAPPAGPAWSLEWASAAAAARTHPGGPGPPATSQ